MRRRFLIVFLALLVVALAVPVVGALSLDGSGSTVETTHAAVVLLAPQISEAGRLILAGGVLLVLASVVRRNPLS